MQVNRYLLFFLLIFLGTSCIDPYHPLIEESQEVLIIYGVVTDHPGLHKVTVSSSTPYNDPSLVPVSGCVVRVEDALGEMVLYSETDPGVYEAFLTESFLGINRSYSLFVNTPDGQDYQSSYDTLLACPPVDRIYFEVEAQGTSDPEVTFQGIQFYSDLTGSEETSRNFRWKLEETWEYNSAVLANLIWYGGKLYPILGDSINTCYMTEPIRELYSASTRYLAENKLTRNKLAFVSGATPRIKLQYSLLVKQQSLTGEIFNYWEKMKSQNGGEEGLYETQPSSTVGNIYNVTNPEAKVLGCFYATQEQSKRLTIKTNFDFIVKGFTCQVDTARSLDDLGTAFPYLLRSLDPLGVGPPYLNGSRSCFDCQIKGGTNEEPEYWLP